MSESKEVLSGAVDGDFVEAFKGSFEVAEVCQVGVFDSKVVNYQGKSDRIGFMAP